MRAQIKIILVPVLLKCSVRATSCCSRHACLKLSLSLNVKRLLCYITQSVNVTHCCIFISEIYAAQSTSLVIFRSSKIPPASLLKYEASVRASSSVYIVFVE